MSLNDLNLSYSRFKSLKSQGAEKWTTLSTTVASEGMHHNEIQPYRVRTMSSKGENPQTPKSAISVKKISAIF